MEEYTIINALDKEGKGITVYVKDGIIMDVNGKSGGDVIDAGGNYLLPGLIDMHIHGAGGFGSDLNITEDNLSSMAAFLESRGVTSFLLAASCSLSFLQRMKGLLENSSYLRAHVIGVYFEGPFINMAKKGGLPADSIREPDEAFLDELLSYRIEGKPIVKVMTVAPELEGADKIINKLKEAGVVVSFGHSLASYSDAAKYPGCHVTHLYNAQREIDHRKAGLSLYPFRDRSVTAELIADGVHVDMDVVDFTVDTIGDRICLISDGMSFCGLGAGKGKYLGRDIYSDGKACYYSDDN
ncbi:MAG: amidohydrolase family protein, partial [Bullifex sp.]|nr:amidohydrolase family protein [Bullifex sp.]